MAGFCTEDSSDLQSLPQALSKSEKEIDLRELFEIPRIVDWIQENNFQNVALQFPDHLCEHASEVVEILDNELGGEGKISVLGDTSFGECCVDIVAASHLCKDQIAIVHFGHACLAETEKSEILYIFTKRPFDTREFVTRFAKESILSSQKVSVFYDVEYTSSFINMEIGDNVFLCHPRSASSKDINNFCGRLFNEKCSVILYVGSKASLKLLLALRFNEKKFIVYDPFEKTFNDGFPSVSRELNKRYYMIEKIKDANRIGILIGTLSISKYREIMRAVKNSIKQSGKKCYTFLVGKPNVPKLANFPEIDVFVIIACPENSLALDSKEFYSPIVTPFELDVALNSNRIWNGSYLVNFHDLLPDSRHFLSFVPSAEETDVSLITGKIRNGLTNKETAEGSLIPTNNSLSTLHAHGGGEYLSERIWKGLEQKLGETKVLKEPTEGYSGIPSGYTHETNKN